MKILALLAVVTIAGVLAAACGGDDDDIGSNPINGVGPGISIGEAMTSSLDGPLLVNGHLHVQSGQVRLCEVLAESFPASVWRDVTGGGGLGPDDDGWPDK